MTLTSSLAADYVIALLWNFVLFLLDAITYYVLFNSFVVFFFLFFFFSQSYKTFLFRNSITTFCKTSIQVRRRPSSGIIFSHFRIHLFKKRTDRVRGRGYEGREGESGSGGGRRRGKGGEENK